MVCDEAPAATIGGVNERECDREETDPVWGAPASIPKERPDQPRCCGNPSLKRPAGIDGGWLALSHSSCVPAQHCVKYHCYSVLYRDCSATKRGAETDAYAR
jgi:hypothetical protein